jgi:hypothetical protein
MLSPIGQQMAKERVGQEIIIRTRRAVDSTPIEPTKRTLNEDEKLERDSPHSRYGQSKVKTCHSCSADACEHGADTASSLSNVHAD